jgi:glutamyl-tRNA synthetase
VGNARTALFNWLMARGQGGTFIVRIEDTDVERSSRESEQAILDDLHWLGLEWTEGVEAGGEHGPYRQTERLHVYRAHAIELLSSGKAYHCFCSAEQLETDRQDALKAGKPPKYTGRCRAVSREDARKRIENGEAAVIRFRVPDTGSVTFDDIVRGPLSFDMDVIGDFVLLRSNGVPAYNFAVVIDDALMNITHIVRGEDHISNTPRQVLLYRAIGWTPPIFAHVPVCTRAGSRAAVQAARCNVGEGVSRPGLSSRGVDQLPRVDRVVALVKVRSCCRSTSWPGGSGSRTSGIARACSTRRSWPG